MALRQMGISFEVTLPTEEVLTQLRVNHANHQKLVAEAREGYIARAQAKLLEKLAQLKEGKPVSLQEYNLTPPRDFAWAYETTIAMLSRHEGPTVRLNADEYRHLIEDVWEWTGQFVSSNSSYSKSTAEWAARRKVDE